MPFGSTPPENRLDFLPVQDSRRQIMKLLGAAGAFLALRNGLWRPAHARTPVVPAPKHPAVVRNVSFMQSAGYSRIVIECDSETGVTMQEIPADPAHGKTDRVVVDLKPARRSPNLPVELKIGKGILLGVRTGQFDTQTVRVVLDFETMNKAGLSRLFDPFRVILDIDGRNVGDLLAAGDASGDSRPRKDGKDELDMDSDGVAALLGGTASPAVTPAHAGRRHRVILDPGHGGKDPGAVGPAGTQEKRVALAVAEYTAETLEKTGYEVLLTRTNDRYLELTERTAFANKNRGDLFVSIHCNAAKNRDARGVETYYLNPKVDSSRALLIAKENFSSLEAVQRTGDSFADAILSDLAFSLKEGESRDLADKLLRTLWAEASGFSGTQNRGLGHGPLYVLIGARMPSSLVELSFISHPKEERLLASIDYQKALAQGLAAGAAAYLTAAPPVKGG